MTFPIKIDPTALITKTRSILASQIDNETVMMDTENGEYYGMNQVGSRIWELLDTPQTLSQLQTTLLLEFEITEKECLNDIELFVGQLLEKRMVRI